MTEFVMRKKWSSRATLLFMASSHLIIVWTGATFKWIRTPSLVDTAIQKYSDSAVGTWWQGRLSAKRRFHLFS